jgi:hypothetical protein
MAKKSSLKLRSPTSGEWIKFSLFSLALLLVLVPLLIGLFKGNI